MEKYSEKRRLGNFAEDIAEMFLVKLGFNIKNRNYLKKWGELDIVADKKSILHFIEVKSSISRENRDINVSQIFSQNSFTTNSFQIEISHETNEDVYRPEENVHFWKQKRMLRTIETYLLEKNIDDDQEWQIDILSIKLDFIRKVAIIDHIENVVFEV